MKLIRYNDEKRKKLIIERGIDLLEIVYLIEDKKYTTIINHPKKENQRIFIIKLNNYICCVPFVETDDEIFLKTAYYSRKMNTIFNS